MGTWQAKVEANTLITADNHREIWDTEDLEFVAAFRDEASDEELAITLGRSYFAITSIKRELDERIKKDIARRAVENRRKEVGYDYVTTFPPGWFD